MCKFTNYVESLGFEKVELFSPIISGGRNYKKFGYKKFDAAKVRATLGKAKKFGQGRFVFVIDSEKAVRVDTKQKKLWLGNGSQVVNLFLDSLE
jgi:dihydrofolate reductase